ncbi:MAG TPA: hemerythrin domain-containing protein [Dehalococcoidia bacterium]
MSEQRDPPRAVAVLLEEHAVGRRYLEPLERLRRQGDGGPDAETLLTLVLEALAYLDASLEEHIAKEEEALFPPLKARLPADDRLIDEMVAEHDYVRMHRDDLRAVIEDLLAGHDDLDAGREELRAALRAAAETRTPEAVAALRHAAWRVAETALIHFENEEELVFPLAPQLLTPDELAEAARAMDAIAARFAGAEA